MNRPMTMKDAASSDTQPGSPATHWMLLGAVALAAGGLAWMFKASAILLTGWQPPPALEMGQALSAVGVLGLGVGLNRGKGRLARAGAVLGGLSLATRLAASGYERVPGVVVSGREEFVFPYSLLVLAAAVGLFVGLILVGAAGDA